MYQIKSDYFTAVFYTNKRGGTRSHSMCSLAILIWKILKINSIRCLASHIVGSENVEADYLSFKIFPLA